MLKAGGTLKKLELTADGIHVTTLEDGKMAFAFVLGGKPYVVTRKGFWGPTYELSLEKEFIVSLKQVPMFNQFAMSYGGQDWKLKAIKITATKFGLFRGEQQVGSISSTHLIACREVIIDLPPALPIEVQAFLMWIVWWKWINDSSS